MNRLSDRDLGAMLRFAREAFAQPDPDHFARYVVAKIPDVVGAQRISYNEIHPGRGVVRAIINPVCDLPLLTRAQCREHPMMQRFAAHGDGRPYRFSDFLTAARLHETAMYQEHYRLAGVEHQMSFFLGRPGRHVIGFALGRDQLDFSERDRLVLDLLRPHLVMAYDQASTTARVHARMGLLTRAADLAGGGVVLLDARGRIEFATRGAQRWLREYFPRRGRPSTRPPAAVAEWLVQRREWEAGGALAPSPGPLVVRRPGRTLTIRVAGPERDRALLLEEGADGVEPGALAPLGLTRRESEVLAFIARGASNDAIASQLGARPRTVAKHVERIHRKLGVENRAAAAARAHELARAHLVE